MSVCVKCGKNLTYNEIGAYRKFVNRGGKDFLCKECLAKRPALYCISALQRIRPVWRRAFWSQSLWQAES